MTLLSFKLRFLTGKFCRPKLRKEPALPSTLHALPWGYTGSVLLNVLVRRRAVEALAVLAILAVAAFFRFYLLDQVPPGIDLDEARDGLEAVRILAGEHPIMFTTFDPREPAFFYSLAACIAVLGRTAVALRAAPALWGVAAVGLTYAVARQWFGRWVAVLASLGMAASFWQVVASRWSIHAITYPTVLLLFLFVFWEAVKRRRTSLFLLSGVCLAICVYSFVGSRLMPLMILIIMGAQLWLKRESLAGTGRALLLSAAVCAVLLAPLGFEFLTDPSSFSARASEVSVFSKPLPGIEPLTPWQTTLRTLGEFFISGDESWHKNIPFRPVFDWWLAVPFCIGVIWVVRYWRSSSRQLHTALDQSVEAGPPQLLPGIWLLAALFVTLIPGFLARPAPHFSRTMGSAPFAYMLLALGMAAICSWLKSRSKWLGLAGKGASLALIGLLALTTFRDYFGYWAHTDGTLHDFEYGQVVDSDYLNQQRDSSAEYCPLSRLRIGKHRPLPGPAI